MLSEKDIRAVRGLSDEDASERLKAHGYNELPSAQRRSVLRIVFDVFKEPMFILLVICGAIYLVLGDVGEAVMLLGFVFVIMGITIYQEGKAEKAIETLKGMSSPRALVIRGGEQKRISGREVVIGDIILAREGDRVPADAVLLWGINITVDESLLTGESVPVLKAPSNAIFSGTIVVQGQGMARVVATASDTEMGRIGKMLGGIQEERTFLQKETDRLVSGIFVIALVLCLVVVIAYVITRGDWLRGVLSGITLAMAMLPEEFPVVLTIFLALGAWRLSKNNVLTRKVSAVEILGSSTVLCVDKTGTLTQNKMSIKNLFNGRDFFNIESDKKPSLPEAFHELMEFGILASKRDPFDPMEKALEELGRAALYNTEHIHMDWPLIEEYPLSNEMLALSHVWKTQDARRLFVAAKGAPEAVADLCHLNARDKEKLSKNVHMMAGEGLRVLGIAGSSFAKQSLPGSQHDFDFKFVGLIGLADPIRDSVPSAVKECYEAGIRVVMITGDYPVTAERIAREIGLECPGTVITGPEMEKMDFEALRERLREASPVRGAASKAVNVFSRVTPKQKLLIVEALKANGETVAMTGDGVNDAPALKSAHIGVAMGERGTDVARESSDIVLLNDDFSSIVEAVRLGRRIFDNLKKAMAYIISVHVPIAGSSLIPILCGWPIMLYPVHIVFLELIIDPACSVVFESEPAERNIMRRPPRGPKESLFGRKMVLLSVLQGLFSLLVVLGVFKAALALGQPEAMARTAAFTTLIVSNICLILTNRSWSKSIISSLSVSNRALIGVICGAAAFLLSILYVPFLQRLFHFGGMNMTGIFISLCAGISSVLWFEFLKLILNKINVDLLSYA